MEPPPLCPRTAFDFVRGINRPNPPGSPIAELAAAPTARSRQGVAAITTLGVVNHDIGRRDGRRATQGATRARCRIVGMDHAELAAAPVRNALRAFSGRSQGVGVVMAWESGRIGRREALRGAQGVESGQGCRMCRAWAW